MAPEFYETAFNCPHCFAYSQQNWYRLRGILTDVNKLKSLPFDAFLAEVSIKGVTVGTGETLNSNAVTGAHISVCWRCKEGSIWKGQTLVFPSSRLSHHPSFDMPEDVKADFLEAASIAHLSPRGAAGLLRLALEKLCHHLGDPNKKIDTNIKAFVAGGLSVKVQQALDAVRVIGNEAVHPGEMDLKDDKETVDILFGLVNLIVTSMITEPKQVEAIYAKLPESKRAGIENRDKKPDS